MATMYAKAAGGLWSAAGTWSATGSGGVDSAGPPVASTDVILESGSGAVTIDSGAVCRSLDATSGTGSYAGTLTHNAVTLTIGDATVGAGSKALTFSAGMTYTIVDSSTSKTTFASTSTTQQSITTAGKTTCSFVINGVGSKYLLADAHTIVVNGFMQVIAGTLDTGNQTCIWADGFDSSATGSARTLTLGSSAISITGAGAAWSTHSTNLTMTANTAVVTHSGGGGVFTTSGASFNYNGLGIVFTNGGAASITTAGTLTLANITYTGTASTTGQLKFAGNVTMTGRLTVTGNSALNRVQVPTGTNGTAQTVTAATVTLSNADFADIAAAGASIPWTGTSMGDRGGNTNITFDAPATQTHTASAGGSWSDASKWTSRVPLPQDDVIVDASTTGTITLDVINLGKGVNFTGFAGTISWSSPGTVYGSLTLATGVTMSGSALLTLSGRASCTLTSAGKTFGSSIAINAPGGTYTLADNLTSSLGLSLAAGTLATANFTVQCTTFTQTLTSTLTLGSSTVNLQSTATTTVWNMASTATVNAGTSTIVINAASANQRTFAGGGKTYNVLTYTVAGSTGALVISGSNTFDTINFSDVTNARTLSLTASTSTTVTTFNVVGTSGKLMSIISATAGTRATLIKRQPGLFNLDYLSVKDNAGTPNPNWYAGTNSTDAGNNTGWSFTVGSIAKPMAAVGVG